MPLRVKIAVDEGSETARNGVRQQPPRPTLGQSCCEAAGPFGQRVVARRLQSGGDLG